MARKISYFVWRDGRPRWSPGQSLREKGFKGRDLKDAFGEWLPRHDAEEAAIALNAAAGVGTNASAGLRGARTAGTGYIYFLWCRDRVKIGFSASPTSRFKQLQTGLADEGISFVVVPGTLADERRLHRELTGSRTAGEWFKANLSVLRVAQRFLEERTKAAMSHEKPHGQ